MPSPKRLLAFFALFLLALLVLNVWPAQAGQLPYQVYLPLLLNGQEGGITPSQTPEPTATQTPTPTATSSPTPTSTPVTLRPETAFGMQAPDLTAQLNNLVYSGATWVESAHHLAWADVEPTQGARNWTALAALEAEIQAATTQGLRVILVVDSTPEWARAVPGTGTHCGPVADAKFAAFATFVGDLVTRYSAPPYQVSHYALWDGLERSRFTEDPQTSGCWGNPLAEDNGGSDYAAMLQVAYPALHAASPDATLLLGRLELSSPDAGGVTFLNGVQSAGGLYDGVRLTTHDEVSEFLLPWGTTTQYVSPQWGIDWFHGGPEVITQTNVLAPVLTGKEVFVTSNLACDPNNCPSDFSQAEGSYLAQLYAHAAAHGWRVMWQGVTSLQAQPVYQTARQTYGTATYLGQVTSADVGGLTDVFGHKFVRDDGVEVWVLWAVSAEVAEREVYFANLPDWAFDAWGVPKYILPWVNVSPTPVYIEWWP